VDFTKEIISRSQILNFSKSWKFIHECQLLLVVLTVQTRLISFHLKSSALVLAQSLKLFKQKIISNLLKRLGFLFVCFISVQNTELYLSGFIHGTSNTELQWSVYVNWC